MTRVVPLVEPTATQRLGEPSLQLLDSFELVCGGRQLESPLPRSGCLPSWRCTISRCCGALSQGRSGSTRTKRTQPEACARLSGVCDGWTSGWSRRAVADSSLRRGRCRRPRRRRLGTALLDPSTELRGADVAPIWRPGQLLPDWYDDWVAVERERLRELRAHALEALCHRLTAAGRFGEATEAGLAVVRDEPLREKRPSRADRRPPRGGQSRGSVAAVPRLRAPAARRGGDLHRRAWSSSSSR